ncbi:MAG: thiamine phosphate synthase [Bosea sp. (in: a-proteobacteria)]
MRDFHAHSRYPSAMSNSHATTEPARLMLVTPPLNEVADWPTRLADACKLADASALLVRLAPADERGMINLVKAICAPVQALGVAVMVEADVAVCVRGGADGAHLAGDAQALRAAREQMPAGRSVGAGHLRSRHDAMDAGEANVDYVMFGEPRSDGSMPNASAVIERATWWAEIFQVPCVAYAADEAMIAPLAATHAEFIALGEWIWEVDDLAGTLARCVAMISDSSSADAPA